MGGCLSYKQISNEDMLGKYTYSGIYGVSAEMELKKNNTFVYSWQEGLNSGVTKGNWVINKNVLLLNSEKQPNESNAEKYKLLETGKNDKSGITVQVLDKNGYPIRFANCVIHLYNGEQIGGVSDENGMCIFEKEVTSIKKIFLSYVGYYPVDYNTENTENNYFKIMMKEEEPHYEFFTNEHWQIKFSTRNKCLINRKRKFCKNP